MKSDLKKEIVLPPGCTAHLVGHRLTVKGPQGEVSREYFHPRVHIGLGGNTVVLSSPHASKKEKTILGSFTAHIKNAVRGVQDPHTYNVKICSGHFPMSVSASKTEFIVKNFFGETIPRTMPLRPGVTVKVSDKDVVVTSPDIELAGQTAASMEQLCRISQRDRRIFMDGIWITGKSRKKV